MEQPKALDFKLPYGNHDVHIAGLNHRKEQLTVALSGYSPIEERPGRTGGKARKYHIFVQYRPEPGNAYDKQAVAVYLRGIKIGYIPRNENRKPFEVIKRIILSGYRPIGYASISTDTNSRNQIAWVSGTLHYTPDMYLGLPEHRLPDEDYLTLPTGRELKLITTDDYRNALERFAINPNLTNVLVTLEVTQDRLKDFIEVFIANVPVGQLFQGTTSKFLDFIKEINLKGKLVTAQGTIIVKDGKPELTVNIAKLRDIPEDFINNPTTAYPVVLTEIEAMKQDLPQQYYDWAEDIIFDYGDEKEEELEDEIRNLQVELYYSETLGESLELTTEFENLEVAPLPDIRNPKTFEAAKDFLDELHDKLKQHISKKEPKRKDKTKNSNSKALEKNSAKKIETNNALSEQIAELEDKAKTCETATELSKVVQDFEKITDQDDKTTKSDEAEASFVKTVTAHLEAINKKYRYEDAFKGIALDTPDNQNSTINGNDNVKKSKTNTHAPRTIKTDPSSPFAKLERTLQKVPRLAIETIRAILLVLAIAATYITARDNHPLLYLCVVILAIIIVSYGADAMKYWTMRSKNK
ncbi:MAG: hypothetical protein QM613_05175 [Micrococcaceae bacterium]